MKKSILSIIAVAVAATVISCGGGDSKTASSENASAPANAGSSASSGSYDPKRGEGKYDETNVQLGALNAEMASKGESIAGTKCMSCHKVTDEKLVGPGWKGVTTRKTAHWIMNFITNPDPMIDKDPEVQAQLELCLVRMPNQNLQDAEAREIVEFMRKNDGVK